MAASTTQYAYRAQKVHGRVGSGPDYGSLEAFEATARTFQYSPDGRYFGYALSDVVRVLQVDTPESTLVQEFAIPNIVELNFSPRSTFLSTWERPAKLEEGQQHKNHRVFSLATGSQLTSFTQKSQDSWDLQYTSSESHAIRLVGPEIQVFEPADWEKGIVDKLRVEGCSSVTLSPGLNPSLAVFVGEKKGAPASVKIYGLLTLASPPTCQKTFYKADRTQIKWNNLGTQVLVLTQTEVDKTNKSYYGETGLYLLSAAGNFDCRVTLDKEGPIHDFAWSPNSKEFGVVYGYMPAKAVLFDQRVRTLHDFGSAPYNFISFNPQARLIALAGFGNLAGQVSIFDRRTLQKVTTISAPNTSHCSWSPDGRFLLTATLSPRLRVDNGVKIWHCTGPLIHIQPIDELYQVSWKPFVGPPPVFPATIPTAPKPSSAAEAIVVSTPPVASDGVVKAYRPPGARGGATPSIFKREDEGGMKISPSGSPSSTPGPPGSGRYSRDGRDPRNGGQVNGNGIANGGRRYVPGAAPSPPIGNGNGHGSPSPGPKNNKKKKGKAGGPGGPGGGGAGTPPTGPGTPQESAGGEIALDAPVPVPVNAMRGNVPGLIAGVAGLNIPGVEDATVPPTPSEEGGNLDTVAKKVRNLTKKLKAIEELKEKAKRGERLEATQVRKMDGEADIRKELAALGGAGAT
ncbi:translation initiation factor eIF-2A [Sistotremastrum suecicum HHB10207 ss-3]|uniref:Eukaryotic translation initiation factor 2A n=1 Tax=Sistotremastrum suecicum HHB10207 ss-3 TaxID=1314776 RepID=A0A166C9E9_9AGAM|nr:translation initiation factor eIF-2A [Sistotremastrum suecicum HHB10207 ss-3]